MGNTSNAENTLKKHNSETLIMNQYHYTDVLMEEVQSEWAKQSYMNFIPLMIIILVCAFFTWREFSNDKTVLAVLFAIIGVGCLVTIIVAFISTNKKKNAAISQFHDTYQGKGFEYKIAIEGNHIRSYKDGVESVNLRKGDVRGSFETERFFVFQLSGERLLPLKKGSFIKGNIEACRTYIPQAKK